ncbi:hypothetical protein NSZ01_19450 [Nocardioides szechwanensis]|uniref:5'-nucleotidase n=1 Tax=Nocardioides szechwanensis TaxID=1005944 RepID=A0A1H0H4U4_9ACTN|nr:bifunctional UDP-sugar hydrolase/5'-nucleotidase [Nocardioides szechwanensis]GEP34177.1 hypothetical protein NSZ01_19450 [Nocardioides szechwanensis]SDO14123.1 5'-nucleotidase [Nocardioides szechwanensis]
MLFSSRSRVTSRLLTAGVGIGMLATPLAFVAPAAQAADPVNITILGTNDFHGRLETNLPSNSNAEAGAAVLAGAVKQIRNANANTVFAAAGDLIGASTFDSFIQNDIPTIDALNEAGLEVSAVGNHEFDQGYADLAGRVQDRAEWRYLAANVEEPGGADDLAETWIRDFGRVDVGFIGAVTEDLPSLVTPAGIAGLTVTDVVDATNEAADSLESRGADVIVLLVHEGAAGTSIVDATNDSAFGKIVNGVDSNVDAIISGHTHLAYNHSVPVPEWVAEGRAVTERPVVSAGQYGSNLNQINFSVDPTTGEVLAKTQEIVALEDCIAGCSGSAQTWEANFPADPATKAIVDDAVAQANVLGSVPLGEIEEPFTRGKLANGTTENRGAESTLGNLVAEIQQWATESPEAGGAQIAFMNPGGLRADLAGTLTGDDRIVSYRQAATVQSFANTLVNMRLTGADIKEVLEQQWQTNPGGTAPSRPFLKLGTSEGFEYTYDPNAAEGSRITSMSLHGQAINPATAYSVTVNSFLGTGGDNFRAFSKGTNKRDTGKVDLQTMVDYLAEFANTGEGDAPLPVDFTQRAVGVLFPVGAPAVYDAGDTVAFDVSSWSFTAPTDVKDTEVVVSLGDAELGSFPLDNAAQAALPGFDEVGKASVSVTLPASVTPGPAELVLTGAATGTSVSVPIVVAGEPATVKPTMTVKAPAQVKRFKVATVKAIVKAAGAPATGKVKFTWRGKSVVKTLVGGVVSVKLGGLTKLGPVKVTVTYLGNSTTSSVTKTVTIRVVRP